MTPKSTAPPKPVVPAQQGTRREAVGLSRRDLLKHAAVVGVVAGVSAENLNPTGVPVSAQGTMETLTAGEFETLEAIVARLIPSDENGPGATEARAARYIDGALSGALASSRDVYAAGLAAVDVYAEATKGGAFARLSPQDQDSVLREMEENVANGFTPSASAFFNVVRSHTIQGTFCDPHYGGNADFIGWDLIGYPGLRLSVGPDDQRMDVAPETRHVSAYELEMFSGKGNRRGR